MNYTYQKSSIQQIRESQMNLDNIKKNLLNEYNSYDIKYACLKGSTDNIYNDMIKRGYFECMESYQTLNEAIQNIKLNQKLLISYGHYYIGMIKENLKDCNMQYAIYNIYSGDKIHDPNEPIKAYMLDNIRTPDQLKSLYEKINESGLFEENDFDFIKCWEECNIPEDYQTSHDTISMSIMANIWDHMHECLTKSGLKEEQLIIEGLSYTKFAL